MSEPISEYRAGDSGGDDTAGPGPRPRRGGLIATLRANHRARIDRTPLAETPPPPRRAQIRAFDFATLPAYRPISLQRSAAEALDIASPFFRVHDSPPGPVQRIAGVTAVNFASYNYLGLNGHPEVADAARRAVDRWGMSASASRVVGGERPCHRALETALAQLYGVEEALVMVSGHATNVTTIGTLMGPDDLILTDALIHNSIAEGVRLSGATRLSFPHNDLDWLDDTLGRVRANHARVLIAVEGLYSMDGDSPDLARLVEIKARHNAWLLVDEAHGLGVLGQSGRGIAEAQGVDPRSVEIWMGTLSKTLAACGGYVAGGAALIDFLKHKAPGFVFSVGVPAPVAAAALAAIQVMRREPDRVARLAANGRLFRDTARAAGLDTGLSEGHAITPIILGDSLRAVLLSNWLHQAGVNALPIIHPAVPEKSARLRFFLTADHDAAQIEAAVAAMVRGLDRLPNAGGLARELGARMVEDLGS